MDAAIEGGFGDSVMDGQSVFRAVMEALARPGTRQSFAANVRPPAPLCAELGALALALCDHETPLWLDAALAGSDEIVAWLGFHSGAPLCRERGEAQFALVADAAQLGQLEQFAQGTDEYPDRSTTLMVASQGATRPFRLTGPGIKDSLVAELALPGGDFISMWAENRERFPRGIDLLLAGDGLVVGLPRSTRISEA